MLLLVFGSSLAAHLNMRDREVVEGAPTVLVAHGEYILESLNRERITPGEIFSEMHKAGLDDLPQVRWAVLETDGKTAIVPEPPAKTQSEQSSAEGPPAASCRVAEAQKRAPVRLPSWRADRARRADRRPGS